MKRSNYFILSLLSILWACDPKEVPGDKTIVTSIDTLVNAVAIDQYNTKWIGAADGLYKSVAEGYELQDLSFDGTIYSLFYEKADDILWIGTGSGLLKGSIKNESISDDPIDIENLSNQEVHSYHIDQNSKRWFGTASGITLNYGDTWKKDNFRFNNKGELRPMSIENSRINSIASINDEYYFATDGIQLWRAFGYDASIDAFSGASQWSYPYNGQNMTDTMFVVFIDDEGKKWMGGKVGIQVHVGDDPKDMGSFTYFYDDEIPDLYVLTITQAANGDIWVGTRKGIGVYNGSDWQTITEGLPDLYITSIAFDNDGSTWVGTKNGLAHIQ